MMTSYYTEFLYSQRQIQALIQAAPPPGPRLFKRATLVKAQQLLVFICWRGSFLVAFSRHSPQSKGLAQPSNTRAVASSLPPT